MSAPFRFGVTMLSTGSRTEWIAKCRRAEELGYDVIGVPDHLGLPSPFPAMMLAAEATERVRLNTFVLNVPFYNPVLLARDVATVDQLSGGRIELGLGAGYVRAEFEDAGIEFPSDGQRVAQVAEAAATLKRLFGDPEYRPQPARQGGPPLLIGGWGEKMLGVAARYADVIGFTGATAAASGKLIAGTPEDLDRRIELVRKQLGNRSESVELNLLLQVVGGQEERAEVVERVSMYVLLDGVEQLDEIPIALFGTPQEQAEQLRVRRERYGIGYITVIEQNMEKLAPVIELLR